MNDTVVVYDRVRENLRKYKKLDLAALLDLSVNDTLSRTVMTSVTTLLALIALAIFGGAVISGFTMAMIWGRSGRYVFVDFRCRAAAHLLWHPPRSQRRIRQGGGGRDGLAARLWISSRSPRATANSSTPTATAAFASAAGPTGGRSLSYRPETLELDASAAGDLAARHLEPIAAFAPRIELLLVGCGPDLALFDDAVFGGLKSSGVAVETMNTGAACRTFNVLLAEDRRVASVLIAVD